jgi:retinol dehydrogenase-12
MQQDLQGKVFLVTGATEGIGKAAAREFVQRGATLVLVARSAEKGERVRAELAALGTQPVHVLLGDLSRLEDVRKVAAAFRATFDRLDVLVNNAGAIFTQHQKTADGLEQTFAVNHLAYFLLTHLLLDVLKKTPGARVVNTSSDAHQGSRLKLDTVARRPSGGAGFPAYADSKLANILFTRSLAKRLAGSGVTVNCFHPGVVRSGFSLNNGGVIAAAYRVAGMFMRTPEKGAETLVWLATSPEAANFNGNYFHDKRVSRSSGRARDETLAAGLWTLSETLCGLT